MSKSDRDLHKKKLKARQTAALPLRLHDGELQVLMITSRDTGRWVLPKGWPMKGRSLAQAARIEALEEAGAVGEIKARRIGRYRYLKRMASGPDYICRTEVFPLVVRKLQKDWKEADERERAWFSPKEAAKLVWEPDLAELLKLLAKDPARLPGMKSLFKSLDDARD